MFPEDDRMIETCRSVLSVSCTKWSTNMHIKCAWYSCDQFLWFTILSCTINVGDMSHHLSIRSPDVKRHLTNHPLYVTFRRRSPGLPLLVDVVTLYRAFRELRFHDITCLKLFKDAHNCSLYTVSDRLLIEHKALLEWQRLKETEVPVSVSLYTTQK